jgi:protein-disulfide isomerase
MKRILVIAFALMVASALPVAAQFSSAPAFALRDTSMLKPPAGAKVAVIEFEDLECPLCAHAYPIVREATEKYHVPLVRYDYPWSFHPWAFDAAVNARWMQDAVSPRLAEQYRAKVFASQQSIATKGDLLDCTRKFLADHKTPCPFVIDPQGTYAREVKADHALGDKLGVQATPTILVVTNSGFQLVTGDPNDKRPDVDKIFAAIMAAQAQTKSGASVTAKRIQPKS